MSAIGRVLDGERSPDALCTGLDREDTLVVQTLVSTLDDPDVLLALAERPPPPA